MAEIVRKVTQLDADVHEIYGLLTKLDENVRDVKARMMRQEGRLNQIESDLQGLAEVQATHSGKLDRIIELLEGD